MSWSERREALSVLAGPVLESFAVQRLSSITFLGILSPKFSSLGEAYVQPCGTEHPHDGSRLDHSAGVALLCGDVARSFGFSLETQRYAAVWGLLHDLGNWPLAHTGELAFRRLTGLTTRQVRRALITGEGVARLVPAALIVRPQLDELGLDLQRLLAMMEYRFDELPPELRTLAEVMQSPLSPDAFEGMWRCGRALGAPTADPEQVAAALHRDEHGTVQVRHGREELVLHFWRCKMHLYRSFLNRPDLIRLESAWSQAIERDYAGLTLGESLQLSEEDVLTLVLNRGLPADPPPARYKPPVSYDLALAGRHSFPVNATMAQIAEIFVSRPLHA